MRPLIIDKPVIDRIAQVIAYANNNPFSFDDLLDIHNRQMDPAGDDNNYVLVIPIGYRVVYSVESQPVGRCFHISISVDKPGALPSVAATFTILEAFGLSPDLTEYKVTLETIGTNHQAVNVQGML